MNKKIKIFGHWMAQRDINTLPKLLLNNNEIKRKI